jgi:type I restriction enzyme, S subunit
VNWGSSTLGEICLPTAQMDPTRTPEKRFEYIDISFIDKDRKEITGSVEIVGSEAPSRARKLIRGGDVLVSTVRPNLNAVAFVTDQSDGHIASTGFCVLRPNPKVAEGKFVFYRCLTPEFVSHLVTRMRGASYPAVSDGVVRSAPISLPPRREQRLIVDLLEQADRLRRKRAEADALADRLLPALFHKMFGDPATNPKGWPRIRLGHVILETAYGTSNPSNTSGEGLPVLRMNNISDCGQLLLTDLKHVVLKDAEAEKHLLADGDLLFNRTNSRELVGKTGLWRGAFPAVAASYLIRVRVDISQVLPDFVWAWMNTPYFKQRLFDVSRRAVGMANINATELRAMPIMIPDVPRQQRFADRLRSLGNLAGQRQHATLQLNALFSTMLHRAFSGELTAKWREAHLKEVLAEIEEQARLLKLPLDEQASE